MLTAAQAKALYRQNWCPDFTSFDDLLARLSAKAKLGAYEDCVYIDSRTTYEEVKHMLKELGFSAEDYNGGGNSILEIGFGA
jgi:hypothetical protein